MAEDFRRDDDQSRSDDYSSEDTTRREDWRQEDWRTAPGARQPWQAPQARDEQRRYGAGRSADYSGAPYGNAQSGRYAGQRDRSRGPEAGYYTGDHHNAWASDTNGSEYFTSNDYGSGISSYGHNYGTYRSDPGRQAYNPPRFYGDGGSRTGGYAYDEDYRRNDGRDRGFFDRASDEVMSWFGDEDAQRRREMDHRGKGPADYKRSDERIREDVNDRLTEDRWLDAGNVTVSVSEGEVTLDGTVADRRSKRRAEDLADSVSGAGHVQNNLRVATTT